MSESIFSSHHSDWPHEWFAGIDNFHYWWKTINNKTSLNNLSDQRKNELHLSNCCCLRWIQETSKSCWAVAEKQRTFCWKLRAEDVVASFDFVRSFILFFFVENGNHLFLTKKLDCEEWLCNKIEQDFSLWPCWQFSWLQMCAKVWSLQLNQTSTEIYWNTSAMRNHIKTQKLGQQTYLILMNVLDKADRKLFNTTFLTGQLKK